TIRTGPEKVTNMGDRIDLLIPLNQDAMNRHLGLLTEGAACIYNADTIKPGTAADGVQLCPLPVSKLADITRNKVAQNTLAVGAGLSMMGIGFQALEEVLAEQFKKKGEAVVAENVAIARAGYDYATSNFKPFGWPLPMTENRYAVLSGNTAMAMGGAAAGGGFALMSEGLGMSAMMETPVVVIDCQRAGPSTGVPTKTEQGDLWQMLGAAFGDYPRVIAAPLDIGDCFKIIPEIFNIGDRFQCPGIVLCDLLLSEGRLSVDPKDLDFNPVIDRGELVIS